MCQMKSDQPRTKLPDFTNSELTDVGRVVGGSEDQLGCTVVPRANVADVGLACHQDLGGTKVTQFQDPSCRVEQQVLGLDVSMADSHRVDVG
jgi:hypothetical protein